jgi:hypothetical protein
MGKARIWFALALLASWAVMGWLYLQLRSVKQDQQNRVILLKQMEKQLGQAEAPAPAQQGAAAAKEPESHPREAAPASQARTDDAARQELIRLVDAKQAQLDATKSALAEVQGKMQEMESRIAALSQEGQQLVAAEKDLRDKLESSARLTDALQAEMKTRNDRLTQLQVANRDLLRRVEETARRLSRLAGASQEMEDINRRREVYVTNILRRYRELTDFYRNLAVRINSAENTTSLANVDLDRMQNVITLADEDMRQLRSLNAQAARLEKELAATRAEAQKP